MAAAAGVVTTATVADRVVVAVGAGVVVIAVADAVVVAVCVAPVVVDKAEPITSKPSNPIVCFAHPKKHLKIKGGAGGNREPRLVALTLLKHGARHLAEPGSQDSSRDT